MKKLIYILILALSTSLFSSCEKDESLDPRAQIVTGLFARLDITHKTISPLDLQNSYFGGTLTNPSGKIVKYNLYVKRRDGFGVATEFSLVKTITSFPYDLKIYVSDIATALNVPTTTLGNGDEYYFWAEAFDADGHRSDYYSLSSTVQGAPGMKQAFRFRTTIYDYSNDPTGLAEYDNYVNP